MNYVSLIKDIGPGSQALEKGEITDSLLRTSATSKTPLPYIYLPESRADTTILIRKKDPMPSFYSLRNCVENIFSSSDAPFLQSRKDLLKVLGTSGVLSPDYKAAVKLKKRIAVFFDARASETTTALASHRSTPASEFQVEMGLNDYMRKYTDFPMYNSQLYLLMQYKLLLVLEYWAQFQSERLLSGRCSVLADEYCN